MLEVERRAVPEVVRKLLRRECDTSGPTAPDTYAAVVVVQTVENRTRHELALGGSSPAPSTELRIVSLGSGSGSPWMA